MYQNNPSAVESGLGSVAVTTDLSQSFEMAKAACSFPWVHPRIIEANFPPCHPYAASFDVRGVRPVASGLRQVITEIERLECRPANLMELIALAAQERDAGLHRSIVCLGTVSRLLGLRRYVVTLDFSVLGRGLFLCKASTDWIKRANTVIACVRQ
jgi:hypothetical protein